MMAIGENLRKLLKSEYLKLFAQKYGYGITSKTSTTYPNRGLYDRGLALIRCSFIEELSKVSWIRVDRVWEKADLGEGKD